MRGPDGAQIGRVRVLATGISIFFVLLMFRLYWFTVIRHDAMVIEAKDQQTVERDILPRRGDVYIQDAAAGKTVLAAQSVERFALSATPKNVTRKAEYAHLIAQKTGVDEAALRKSFDSDSLYMRPIKHDLTTEEVNEIVKAVNDEERKFVDGWTDVNLNFDVSQGNILYFQAGFFFIREYQRVYPEGALAGQLMGFVNDDGEGQYGLEGQYDQEMQGYAGKLLLEQDSLGRMLQENGAVQGKNGSSYQLSIDRNIQYIVEKELAAQVKDSEAASGSVIVMDPKTGEIIAMANQPSYDPNNFRDVPSSNVNVFDNPSISHIWEPGSIMKPLVMSAALDLGLVKPDTKEVFPESVTVSGYKIETALRKAYGEETMTKVLVNSDNVAMVWVADKLGNKNMYEYLHKYGLGNTTGVDLKNEVSGSLLSPERWKDINRATMAFGQGIAVTPMQIISAYAAVANQGKSVQPHVVKAVQNDGQTWEAVKHKDGEQIVKPETAAELKDMMVATVRDAHARAGVTGYEIAGKTGTAQIPDPKNGGYIEDAYNHSFVGFGPADNPKFLMLVKIDNPNLKKAGLFAESTAVPLFGRIAQYLLNYYQVPPDNKTAGR